MAATRGKGSGPYMMGYFLFIFLLVVVYCHSSWASRWSVGHPAAAGPPVVGGQLADTPTWLTGGPGEGGGPTARRGLGW